MRQKTLMRGVAAATIALPVALANPTAVRSCGGGPQLNAPGSTPSDKLESAQKKDPLEDEPLPGLDDDRATSAPAPVEAATNEGEADDKPAGFESVETDGSASESSTRGGENGSITIGGTAGDQPSSNDKAGQSKFEFTYTPSFEYTLDDHLNPGPTAVSSQVKGLAVGMSVGEAKGLTDALSLIEQDKGGLDADPDLLAAYDEIEDFLSYMAFWSGIPEDSVADDMNTLRGLPAGDARRSALIGNLRQFLATIPRIADIPSQPSQSEPVQSVASPDDADPDTRMRYVSPTFRSVQIDLRFDAEARGDNDDPRPGLDDDVRRRLKENIEAHRSERQGDGRAARNQVRAGVTE